MSSTICDISRVFFQDISEARQPGQESESLGHGGH